MGQSRAFVISLVVAILGMLLVHLYVSNQTKIISTRYGDEVSVYVAKQDIKEMQRIERDMLDVMVIPRKFVQPSAVFKAGKKASFVSQKDGKGERLNLDSSEWPFEGQFAGTPIQKGEQILMTKVLLSPIGTETGLSRQVAVTKRAMAIPINDITGVTKLLKPGDHVDIITGVKYKTKASSAVEIVTLLQSVHVLSVGELVQNQKPGMYDSDPLGRGAKLRDLRKNRNFATITVEVSPPEAQILIYNIYSENRLFLTLRNPVDRLFSDINTSTVDEVLGEKSKKYSDRMDEERRKRKEVAAAAAAAEEARRAALRLRQPAADSEKKEKKVKKPTFSFGLGSGS